GLVPLSTDDQPTGCVFVFQNRTGQIASPDHPLWYSNDANCSWTIALNEGCVIQLKFDSFASIEVTTTLEPSQSHFNVVCGILEENPECILIKDNEMHPLNSALTMSPRLVMKRLQSNCQARRTDQQPNSLEEEYDWLRVYDGIDNSAVLLGEWSGTELPPILSSTSNYLHINMTSDSFVRSPGFSANFTS
ncbi:hypothetical protein T265_14265, partial [Opisthorchis viverrini]